MTRSRGRPGLEPLGLVLLRDSALRVPASIETSPVAPRDWEAAVGSRIAARARPLRLDRGVLLVRTATATWAQELSLLTEAILSQLRGRGLTVDALRFQVGPVDAPARPPSRAEVRTAPAEVPLPQEVHAVVAAVADPDLRDAIAHAAARNLGWQAAQEPPPAPQRRPSRGRARQDANPGPGNRERREANPGPWNRAREQADPFLARAPKKQADPTSAPSAAPAPRSAGPGSGPPARTKAPAPAGPRRRP